MSCEYIMNNAYFVGIIQYKFTLRISQDTIWIDFQHSTLPDSRKSTFPYVFCLVSVWEGFGKWPPPPQPNPFSRSQLQAHGAIWFRNFESTKQPDGFREFYEALQLNPCLDPIHTSGF